MARKDARLLHELEGIAEEHVTNLDDFSSLCIKAISFAYMRLEGSFSPH